MLARAKYSSIRKLDENNNSFRTSEKLKIYRNFFVKGNFYEPSKNCKFFLI